MKLISAIVPFLWLLPPTALASNILQPPFHFAVPALSDFRFIFEAGPIILIHTIEHVDVALQRSPVTEFPSNLISLGTLNNKTGYSVDFTLPGQAAPGKYYLIAIEHVVNAFSYQPVNLNILNQTFAVTHGGPTIAPVPVPTE